MEWTAAIIGILGSLIVAYFTAEWRARHERDRLREELKLEYSVETAIRHLMTHESFKKRSFGKIKRHIRGFEDDNELRRALLRAGAVCFDKTEGDDEVWGLLSRNLEDIR